MASSRRPRSSTTSLAPRSLRTFRALAQVRGAFPLTRDVLASAADASTFHLILIGSPEATPAALRAPIRARLLRLTARRQPIRKNGRVEVRFIPGAASLGHRIFRSGSLRSLRTLLQGDTAILQIKAARPVEAANSVALSRFVDEACRAFPGFTPSGYRLALPSLTVGSNVIASFSIRRSPTFEFSANENPQVKVLSSLVGLLGQSLAFPIRLSRHVGIPLVSTGPSVARTLMLPRAVPALYVLNAINAIIRTRSLSNMC